MTDRSHPSGPLAGLKVIDVSALGPGPFGSILLADHGAEVITISRPSPAKFDPAASFSRGKRSIIVDIRSSEGREVVHRLAADADVFLEGFRPGVMERRGLGPDELCAANPRLIYTRLDRIRPGRSVRVARRPRHQLPGHLGHPRKHRARRADSAAQSAR